MKVCSVCKEAKPLSEFHKNRTRRDGHSAECRACHALRDRGLHNNTHIRDHEPGYESLLKAVIERLILDYKMGKDIEFRYSVGDGRSQVSEPDGRQWQGFKPCPQECLEVVMGRDFYDYYFHSISMAFDDSEIRAKILQQMGVK
jgi:hypothetical protein